MNVEICTRTVSACPHGDGTDRTHSAGDGGEPGPEEVAAVLATVVGGDVLDSGIPDMTDDEDGGCSGTGHSAEVVRKSEDGPAVGDSTEVRIRSVRKLPVIDELSADDSIFTALPGCALSLQQ